MSNLRSEAIQFVRAGLSVAADVAKLPGCLEPRVLPPFKLVTVQLKQSEPTEKELAEIDIGIDFHTECTVYVDFGKVIDRDVLEEVAGSLLHTGLEIDGDDLYITFDLKHADRILEPVTNGAADYDPFKDEEGGDQVSERTFRVEDRWVIDDLGNRASITFWRSEDKAKESLLTLRDCTGCTNCRDCTDCTDCRGCTRCTGCNSCISCHGCIGCTDCAGRIDENGVVVTK